MTISIASLALPSKTVQMEFPGYEGFIVDVNYLTKDEMVRIRKVCTSKKFGRSTRQVEEVLDEERFTKEYVAATIKGWKGLKIKYLKQLMLTSDLEEYDDEDEVVYNPENALALVNNSDVFDSWLAAESGDLEKFTASK